MVLLFSFGFVAVVPNTKLAKRSRYLSKNSLRQLDDSQLFRALVSMHPLSQYTLNLVFSTLPCFLLSANYLFRLPGILH